jgi:transcriptional regulator with PAS, ATPase and Fis domain
VIQLFARSKGMREAVSLAERVSVTASTVLITGESGAGKDALALFIHANSSRATQPFVKIDCATLPAPLLEAELFGYERGAFTGANESKPGRLEAANKGTIVLDEVAQLSFDAQAKLLRVIEEREFERLGGRNTIKLDARILALTNVNLDDAARRRAFRVDLFFRLNVIQIHVPPLREREADLSQLVRYFIRLYARKHGRNVRGITAAALETLATYDFPGNARELSNIIERAVIVSKPRKIDVDDLPSSVTAAAKTKRERERPRSLAELEADYIREILTATDGNKTECARILGISRKNLYEKIARYGLPQ